MSDAIELADTSRTNSTLPSANDRRPHIPEPPPVRLVTVEDARLPAPSGREVELDAFYVGMLAFERDEQVETPVYRAANFRLHFDVAEPPVRRDDLRPLGIEIVSLAEAERALVEAEIEYTWQKGVTPGTRSLLLQDPAGNWVELTEASVVG